MSQNLSLGIRQSNICNIKELSTLEVYEWKVRAIINSPGEISISLQLTFNDQSLMDFCSYPSLVYYIPISDILLRWINVVSDVYMYVWFL